MRDVAAQSFVECREEASEFESIASRPVAEECFDAFLAAELDCEHGAATFLGQADQADASVAGVGAPQDESVRVHRCDLPGDGGRVEAER